VVIGGVISSTLMTLFVLPVFYRIVPPRQPAVERRATDLEAAEPNETGQATSP
jgi:hypothetical protein